MPAPEYGSEPDYQVIVAAEDIVRNEMADVETERFFSGVALGCLALGGVGLGLSQSFESIQHWAPYNIEDIGLAVGALGMIGAVSASLYRPLSRLQDRVLFWAEQRRTSEARRGR
jgi:hypothetical protein